ncbi:hypothetical protein RclHR1_02090003 [Rhizophagus clarus]|uniref:Uncharacterized protein n=1 Tax=Rhizophagus clarus TaxID=94130 RepID=A0A2Z6R4M9_9GLOM|nr:hypothetical protein RclHR1_02090003 [Rhizophagus clarus]
MNTTSSDRKNDASCDADRKKIGKKGDGIFRLKGDRLEIGAIEAGRKWEGTNGRKYLKDSLKLSKMLRDMIVQLTKECNGNERIEVASQINNPPLAYVIKDILRAKAIMMQTLELVQEKKSNLDDLDDFEEVNRSEQCTTHNTINLSKTYKTPLRNYLGQN